MDPTLAAASAGPGQAHSADRILALDGLRGVAAAMVVLYHYTVRYAEIYHRADPGAYSPLVRVPWGDLGVRLFLIISGFVIFLTMDRSRHAADFVVARFARLFPVFWVCVGLTFGLVSWLGLPGREATGRDALVNLTMLPGRLGARMVDGAYWSLQVELSFYAVVAIAMVLGLRRWCLGLVAVIVAANSGGVLYRVLGATPREFSWLTFSFGSDGGLVRVFGFSTYWFSLFLIGMTIYDLRRRARWWHAALLAIALGNIVQQHIVERINDQPHPGWGFVAWIVAFALAVFVASRWRVPVLSSRPLVFLGTISYSLYLIHQNVGYLLIRACEGRGVPTNLAILLACGSTITLATALTFLVERPANRAIRRLAERVMPRRA